MIERYVLYVQNGTTKRVKNKNPKDPQSRFWREMDSFYQPDEGFVTHLEVHDDKGQKHHTLPHVFLTAPIAVHYQI
jgi:hypothetical protein